MNTWKHSHRGSSPTLQVLTLWWGWAMFTQKFAADDDVDPTRPWTSCWAGTSCWKLVSVRSRLRSWFTHVKTSPDSEPQRRWSPGETSLYGFVTSPLEIIFLWTEHVLPFRWILMRQNFSKFKSSGGKSPSDLKSVRAKLRSCRAPAAGRIWLHHQNQYSIIRV